MQTQVQTRHIKKQFNHFTMKFETETRAAFVCPHCDGLISYIKLPKLKTCRKAYAKRYYQKQKARIQA